MGTYWYAICFTCKDMVTLGKLRGSSLEKLAIEALRGDLPPLPPLWKEVVEANLELAAIRAVEAFRKNHLGHEVDIVSEYFFDSNDTVDWSSFSDSTKKYFKEWKFFE